MTIFLADRVQETTTTTGTGTLNLSGASAQYRTFIAGIGNGNQTYYCITSGNGSDWEIGIGTVTSGTPNLLSRDIVLVSTNANAAVNLSGTSTVFCTSPASTLATAPGTVSIVQTTAGVGATSAVTFGLSPIAGNVLIAMGTHWSNGPTFNSGWFQLYSSSGASTDGLIMGYKTCGSGETAAQTPFNTSGGSSTVVFEITGLGGPPTLATVFQESAASSLTLTSFNASSGMVIGMFSVQASNFDYSISGATSIDTNVTGATVNNTPRRIKGFHVIGGTAAVNVTATLDSGHNSAGAMFFLPGG